MSKYDNAPAMPFGKHKGKRLDKLPKGYLKWMLAECDLSEDLRQAAQCVLAGKPIPLSMDEQIQAMFDQ